MRFDVYEYTSRGGRSYNEDAVGCTINGENGIFVVADGLGGHSYGEVASACVRDTLLSEGCIPPGQDIAGWLGDKIALANQEILQLQVEKDAVLKSTVVALAVDCGRAVWANVGDSRLYYLHRSTIQSFTNDHSVAYKKYRAGEITREAIGQDEDQSALLRALGSEDRSEAEIYDQDIYPEPGDAFLLCTDGVWEYLRDEEILIDLLKAKSAQDWAELMLLRIMGRIQGENDNLTMSAIMIK